MPELPEVETARRSLMRTAVGKTIARATVRRSQVLRTHSPAGFGRALRGATIRAVARRGKALRFLTDRWTLVFHYMLWGVMRFHPAGFTPDGGTAVLLVFTDGSALEFRELQLSTFHLFKPGRDAAPHEGIDPLAPSTALPTFLAAIGTRGAVKGALCNQARIAGIGNLWAHEILFRSRIRPQRAIASLAPAAQRTLYRQTQATLRAGIAAGGEPGFHDARGRPGRARLAVYGRAGRPCPRCGARIRGGRFHGRPTFFCPRCQT